MVSQKDFNKTGRLYIVDGQHRFSVLKKLNMEIPYSFIDGEPEVLARTLNSSSRLWTMMDYMSQNAKTGITQYSKVIDLINSKNIKQHTALLCCFQSDIDGKNKDNYAISVKNGLPFIFNDNAEDMINYILSCDVPFKENSKFIKAIRIAFPKMDMAQKKKLQSKIITIPQLATPSQYLRAFENILNKNVKNTKQITF